MPKPAVLGPEVKAFLDSISALFEEQHNAGWTNPVYFKLLRAQLLGLLEQCSKTSVSKARAAHTFSFPDGLSPNTELTRPPPWIKMKETDKKELLKTTKTKSLVNALSAVLSRHAKAHKQASDRVESSTPSPEPKPRKRRSKQLECEEDYEPPQAKKAKKTQVAPQQVHRPAPKKLKVVLNNKASKKTAPVEKSPSDKTQTTLALKVTKSTTLVDRKDSKKSIPETEVEVMPLKSPEVPGQVTSNSFTSKPVAPNEQIEVSEALEPKGSPIDVFWPDSASTSKTQLLRTNDEDAAKTFGDFGLSQTQLENDVSKSPETGKQQKGATSTASYPASSTIPQTPLPETSAGDFAKIFEGCETDPAEMELNGSHYVKTVEMDRDTAFENGLFEREGSYGLGSSVFDEQYFTADDSPPADIANPLDHEENDYPLTPFFKSSGRPRTPFPSAPQVAAKHSETIIDIEDSDIDTDDEQQDSPVSSTPIRSSPKGPNEFWTSAPKTLVPRAVSLLQQHNLPFRKKINPPIQRLKTHLEIYKSRISHIPPHAWRKYNKKLEKFVQEPRFSTMSFLERFGRFRRIVYMDEEDAAMVAQDWERVRKAAKLCGFLTEITAPECEDAKTMADRKVSTDISDINWLEKEVWRPVAVNATQAEDAMEGIEVQAAA